MNMTKDNSQCLLKLREPSAPKVTGVSPHFPWHTARGSVRALGIDPPFLVGPIVRCHNQEFEASNFGRRESSRRRKHLLDDPWRAPNVSPSSVGSILSLSNVPRPTRQLKSRCGSRRPQPDFVGLFTPIYPIPKHTT